MRVLVTGASGFIGTHAVRRLTEAGHAVRALVRPTSDLSGLAGIAIEPTAGDLSGRGLGEACAGVEAVVHLGGLTTARSTADLRRVNGEGTRLLAEAAATAGVRRFLYVSSLAAHGPSPTGAPRDPAEPCRPVSAYGGSKAEGEQAALAFADRMAVQILRPPVVYGPRDRGLYPFFRMARWRLIPVMGRGHNRLSLVYVEDLAEAFAALLQAPPGASSSQVAAGEGPYFHIADGEGPYTWRQMVEALGAALGHSVAAAPVPEVGFAAAALLTEGVASVSGHPPLLNRSKVAEMKQRAWVADSAALSAACGWQPRIGLAEGMQRTVAWYRQAEWL